MNWFGVAVTFMNAATAAQYALRAQWYLAGVWMCYSIASGLLMLEGIKQ